MGNYNDVYSSDQMYNFEIKVKAQFTQVATLIGRQEVENSEWYMQKHVIILYIIIPIHRAFVCIFSDA